MSDTFQPGHSPSTLTLRQVLDDRGSTSVELAAQLGVTLERVESWVDGNSTPKLSARNEISKALEVPTRKLWPDLIEPEQLSTQAEFDKLIGIPSDTWSELLGMATSHIDMLGGGYGWWLEQNPQFQQLARQKAHDGLQIRICQADPNGAAVRIRDEVESARTSLKPGWLIGGIETAASMWRSALTGIDNAELRGTENAYDMLMMRFDDYLIVSPYLFGMRGTVTYAELVRRDSHDRKFDHLINGHFEPIWAEATSL